MLSLARFAALGAASCHVGIVGGPTSDPSRRDIFPFGVALEDPEIAHNGSAWAICPRDLVPIAIVEAIGPRVGVIAAPATGPAAGSLR